MAACIAAAGASAQRAEAFNPLKPVCTVGGFISGLVGKACTVVEHGGRLISAGKKLASGHLGSAAKTLLGSGGSSLGSKATFALGLAAVVTWVVGGAKYALDATTTVIDHTTRPQLESTWFSSTYWRVVGIAALLTLPFLFAVAIQALVQSDLALLVRAAFGYLPLAMLGVSIAAPLTMLLLAATDQLSAGIASAAGGASGHFLTRAASAVGLLAVASKSPFIIFFVGVLTVLGAIALWFEMLLRSAAVYVIVLMLPLAFAGLVWPARRVWAIRAVEVLIALILAKFMIVAILALGGAALSSSSPSSPAGMLAGFVLLAMGAATPWVLVRLLPLGEVASGAIGSWRREVLPTATGMRDRADTHARSADAWASTTDEMRRQAEESAAGNGSADAALPPPVDPQPGPSAAGVATESTEADADSEAAAGVANGDITPAGHETSNGTAQSQPDVAEQASERSPGLGPIWQTPDDSWPVLKLGLEDGWPPPPIDPHAGGGTPVAQNADAAGGPDPGETAPETEASGRPHEDHDPTPPAQPIEGGAL